jgi:hypothetical protein
MCPNLWYCIGICVETIRKIAIILSQTGWSMDKHFNPNFLENNIAVVKLPTANFGDKFSPSVTIQKVLSYKGKCLCTNSTQCRRLESCSYHFAYSYHL